jgi:FdhD protein
MAQGQTVSERMRRYDGGDSVETSDVLIVEEPLEIRLDGVRVTTTMRTPGHDEELAVGFCHTDGLLGGASVLRVAHCRGVEGVAPNAVVVDTGCLAPEPTPRLTTTTSSCGWCGTDQVDDVAARLTPISATVAIDVRVLASVPDRVRQTQALFDATGGVHAAAAFTASGDLVHVREDIGRHNAVDKVVGRLLLDDALPAAGMGLFVSGRTSFEIVQKAWAAGFGAVVAVSAPSSLAVEAARRGGLTLAGFARPGRLNIYVEQP